MKKRLAEMQAAANTANYLLRVRDIQAVLDQLEYWNKVEGHALASRMNLENIGMSGHSFGALTTQAVSGQRSPRGGTPAAVVSYDSLFIRDHWFELRRDTGIS